MGTNAHLVGNVCKSVNLKPTLIVSFEFHESILLFARLALYFSYIFTVSRPHNNSRDRVTIIKYSSRQMAHLSTWNVSPSIIAIEFIYNVSVSGLTLKKEYANHLNGAQTLQE